MCFVGWSRYFGIKIFNMHNVCRYIFLFYLVSFIIYKIEPAYQCSCLEFDLAMTPHVSFHSSSSRLNTPQLGRYTEARTEMHYSMLYPPKCMILHQRQLTFELILIFSVPYCLLCSLCIQLVMFIIQSNVVLYIYNSKSKVFKKSDTSREMHTQMQIQTNSVNE